ncbi:MAG: hypothetical protein SFW67_14415 [Myxococcaceae bacterium]|nr:hypothetical protein [Myxococcaceae bacterium]
MSRLNLTLPADTLAALKRHARGQRVTRVARTLIEEGLARAEALERKKALARDYAAGRADAVALLKDFEPAALAELESLDD